MRARELPISDIVKLRPWRGGGSGVEVVETTNNGKIPIFVGTGLDQFAGALAAANPAIRTASAGGGSSRLACPGRADAFVASDRYRYSAKPMLNSASRSCFE